MFEKLSAYAKNIPYHVFPESLYTRDTLLNDFDASDPSSKDRTYDRLTYRHFVEKGKVVADPLELMARALHDQSMAAAVDRFLLNWDTHRIVGVMGGHALVRTDITYRKIVLLSKTLTEKGFLMVSGGGSGAMEATHLGAWLAGRSTEDVKAVLTMLAVAPKSTDTLWLSSAFEVIRRFPQDRYESLGVPTWLFSHEPSNVFATSIAKFFDNNTREQRLLSMVGGGMIFSPGSAGTFMEVFEETALNHYLPIDKVCPMIFFGKRFWTETAPVFPFLNTMLANEQYNALKLSVTDDLFEVIETIEKARVS